MKQTKRRGVLNVHFGLIFQCMTNEFLQGRIRKERLLFFISFFFHFLFPFFMRIYSIFFLHRFKELWGGGVQSGGFLAAGGSPSNIGKMK